MKRIPSFSERFEVVEEGARRAVRDTGSEHTHTTVTTPSMYETLDWLLGCDFLKIPSRQAGNRLDDTVRNLGREASRYLLRMGERAPTQVRGARNFLGVIPVNVGLWVMSRYQVTDPHYAETPVAGIENPPGEWVRKTRAWGRGLSESGRFWGFSADLSTKGTPDIEDIWADTRAVELSPEDLGVSEPHKLVQLYDETEHLIRRAAWADERSQPAT